MGSRATQTLAALGFRCLRRQFQSALEKQLPPGLTGSLARATASSPVEARIDGGQEYLYQFNRKCLDPKESSFGSSRKLATADPPGRVRTKTVKKASRVIIERYYSRMTLDFQTNKNIAEEVAIIPSKRLRNKIAGFATHLMKRIQRGPVRGISLKLQEEERERRMDFVPEESAIKTDVIEVDRETIELLASLNMQQLPGVVQQAPQASGGGFFNPPGGFQGGNRRT